MTTSFQRVLPLEEGCNFRDLGGYRTTDGRSVRPGVLFRSGVMSYFTPNDNTLLTSLGMRTICDLRRADERAKEPTRWPAEIQIVSWDEADHIEARSELSWEDTASGDDARNLITTLYRAMPSWIHTRLGGIFERLINNDVPLLFHCAAGKDRTGLSAAIVLHTLGVPQETIFDDYALTNSSVDLGAFVLKHHKAAMGLGDEQHPLQTMDPGIKSALLSADRNYLTAAFEQILVDHGSLDNYVREQLNVSDKAKEGLRKSLLTD